MEKQAAAGFRKLDIFAHPDEVQARLISPTVLFCDNGDKPLEVNLFAPSLQPGDLVVVHDWNTEIAASDIPETLQPIHEEWWQTTAVFERA
jgi:hypothetical protein